MFLLSNTLEEGAFAFSLTIGIQNSGLKTVVFLANISRPEKVRPAPVINRALRQLTGPLRNPLGLFYRYQKGVQKVVRKTLHGHIIFPFMCVEVLLCQLVASRVKKRLYSTTTHTLYYYCAFLLQQYVVQIEQWTILKRKSTYFDILIKKIISYFMKKVRKSNHCFLPKFPQIQCRHAVVD